MAIPAILPPTMAILPTICLMSQDKGVQKDVKRKEQELAKLLTDLNMTLLILTGSYIFFSSDASLALLPFTRTSSLKIFLSQSIQPWSSSKWFQATPKSMAEVTGVQVGFWCPCPCPCNITSILFFFLGYRYNPCGPAHSQNKLSLADPHGEIATCVYTSWIQYLDHQQEAYGVLHEPLFQKHQHAALHQLM